MATSESINVYDQYKGMMVPHDLSTMEPSVAMTHISKLTDVSFNLKMSDGIRRSIDMAYKLQERNLPPKKDADLNYLLSNSWEKLRLLRSDDEDAVWEWEQPEIERELYHLRRALNRNALSELSTKQVCKVLTNSATLLNHVGRFSDAQEYWDRAISFMPSYALAKGKRGYALTHYAHVLSTRGDVEKFLKKARVDLRSAAESDLYTNARSYFHKRLKWVDTRFPTTRKGRDFGLFKYSQSTSKAEVTYRKWSLGHRLFLNPLNDLGPYPAAMKDTLNVPAVISGKDMSSYCQGIFNQMKQAYVSARYLYYEGISSDKPHFSDKDVLLFDTQDYPSYSLAVEKIKSSFRMTYAIFDKMAFFLNHYMELEIPEDRLSFKSFWYKEQLRENGLRDDFNSRRNWPMRGLFWLSKDLYEDAGGFDQSIEPDAKHMAEARHHLNHKYLKLHEDFYPNNECDPAEQAPQALVDSLAYSMHRSDFEAKTLRMLKRARSALMYMSLAIHYEEKLRTKNQTEDFNLPALTLGMVEDSWKL